MWLFNNSHLCQFIEIVHKIINWYRIWKIPNNCLSVLYKHIIQVENKNVGLKVGGGTNIPLPPQSKRWGAHAPLAPPPPPSLPTPVYVYIYIYIYIYIYKSMFLYWLNCWQWKNSKIKLSGIVMFCLKVLSF